MAEKRVEQTALPALAEGMNRMTAVLRRMIGQPQNYPPLKPLSAEAAKTYDEYILQRGES